MLINRSSQYSSAFSLSTFISLFLFFINDLLLISSNHIPSYADDSTLYSSTIFPKRLSTNSRHGSTVDSISSLNIDLERIASWGAENLVNFNDLKTQLMLMSLSSLPDEKNVMFKIQPINLPPHSTIYWVLQYHQICSGSCIYSIL